MKTRKFTLLFCFMLCACFLSARASSFGDIRVNARFLTDRMAFELNLNQSQYNDLFEINFDFLSGVDPYLTGMACADAAALDAYYRYLDERNDDLRWVLSSSAYARFLAIEYFFRPIYALNNVCYLRVYKVYPNRGFLLFRTSGTLLDISRSSQPTVLPEHGLLPYALCRPVPAPRI